MRIINKIVQVEIIIDDKLLEQISSDAIDQYPKEFGGFLIGYYSEDLKNMYITDYLRPRKYKGRATSFTRSTDGIEGQLKEFYVQNPKKYYLGEWHSHPNGSPMYSGIDLKAMKSIEKCETVRIQNPVLLIISIVKKNVKDFDFYLYKNEKLLKYEK